MTSGELTTFASSVAAAVRNGAVVGNATETNNGWTYDNALLFVFTVVSTVGAFVRSVVGQLVDGCGGRAATYSLTQSLAQHAHTSALVHSVTHQGSHYLPHLPAHITHNLLP